MPDARARFAINTMAVSIARILRHAGPSIYLYGSATTDDFRPGWSDIDLLVLTDAPIVLEQAEELLHLRQHRSTMDDSNPYYCCFEGGMLPLGAFITGEEARTVYWGTTGERIQRTHRLSPFDRLSLLQSGKLLLGRDVRRHLDMPDYAEVTLAVQQHCETIRTHGNGSRSLYAYGWLLDTARCLYTLINGKLASKADAAQWALDERICPVPAELAMALTVRRHPEIIRDETVLDYAASLGPAIQAFADVLEKALHSL